MTVSSYQFVRRNPVTFSPAPPGSWYSQGVRVVGKAYIWFCLLEAQGWTCEPAAGVYTLVFPACLSPGPAQALWGQYLHVHTPRSALYSVVLGAQMERKRPTTDRANTCFLLPAVASESLLLTLARVTWPHLVTRLQTVSALPLPKVRPRFAGRGLHNALPPELLQQLLLGSALGSA